MSRDKHPVTADTRLVRLEELKDFQVADGDQDIRGWTVKTADGNKIGKVEELIVDTTERRVRYAEVKLDGKAVGLDEDRHILVPLDSARVVSDGKDVVLNRLDAKRLSGVPAYRGGSISPDYEGALRDYYAVDATRTDAGGLPRLGENEVTIPLTGGEEVIVRRPGSNEEIVIRKSTGRDEVRD